MPVDPAKLAKLKKLSSKNKTVKVGGKRINKKPTTSATTSASLVEGEKIMNIMKAKNGHSLPDVQEINFFCDDGEILHFENTLISKPTVTQSEEGNVTAITNAKYQSKTVTELLPGILKQVGVQNMGLLEKATKELMKRFEATSLKESKQKKSLTEDDDIPFIEEGKTF
ncbi:hypothetical protein ACO0SA_004367 [Hanseniaspora valbyensis]